MSMEPMRAPHWTEQPSAPPAEVRGPFLTPAVRTLLRAAGVAAFTAVSARVVVDATIDPRLRIAVAAAAAARAMREQRPAPIGALLRRPLPDHREQTSVIEDILVLNTETIARRLDASALAEAPCGGGPASVALEVLDLGLLGLTGFASAPRATTVVLGQPQSSVVPVRDSLGATALGVADVIDLTVHSTNVGGLHAGAQIVRAVARALTLEEAR
ncbi:hypothetical protein ABZ806_37180 [Spirillospora sp. NPDC047418]